MFSYDTKQVHVIDQIDLHKQECEIIYSTLTSLAMETSKLQPSLNNIDSQLKLERMSSLAKDTKIKGKEYLVITLGVDPSDVHANEEIIKRRNADIHELRKKLKLTTT